MNSKQIILIVIIVIALAGGGVFAYFSLTGSGAVGTADVSQGSVKGVILPKGTKLNFEKINKFNETGRTFELPVVTPAETGLPLNDLISQ